MKPEPEREIGERLGELDSRKCADCGLEMTKAEGGTVFTVCSDCWKPKRERPREDLAELQKDYAEAITVNNALQKVNDSLHVQNDDLRVSIKVSKTIIQGLADALRAYMYLVGLVTLDEYKQARAALDAAKPFLPASE